MLIGNAVIIHLVSTALDELDKSGPQSCEDCRWQGGNGRSTSI